MAKNLGGYDLTWFANEALIVLMKALGYGSRIHRGYSPDAQKRGSTITIPKPGTFTAQDAPSNAQDVEAGQVSITLDQWKEVKFALSDKDLNASEDRILTDHIRPAAYALANHIDATLAGLYAKVPWHATFDTTSSATVLGSVLNARRVLRENGAPIMDGDVFMSLGASAEAALLGADFMSRNDGAGAAGAAPLVDGSLARRFGVEFFADGNVPTHTSGTVVSSGADVVGAVNGAKSKGSTTLDVDGLTAAQTIKAGDAFVIAGNTQRYAVTADAVLSGGGAATLTISPALVQDYADNAVVTFENGTANEADLYVAGLTFHRHFAALATAPIEGQLGSQMARNQGIEVETVTDEQSQITLRARRWYDPDNSQVVVALDILFGYTVLDPNLAVKTRRPA